MIGAPLFSFALLLSALSFGCGNGRTAPASTDRSTTPNYANVPYNFDEPAAAFQLPSELVEISGLAPIDSTRLAAVQDEKGIIYVLDRITAAIIEEIRFAGRGDYEGIEAVGEITWILRSDGRLYSVLAPSNQEIVATRHNAGLPGNCDAEGFAFDPPTNRLLIACKENPGRGFGRTRAIYAYDTATLRRVERPAYLIDRQELDAASQNFKPSALAVHPKSGYLYVISSVRKLLLVIDPSHPEQILETRELPETLFPQPEGLAFAPDGTLYISNEGVTGPATLLRFDEKIVPQ